ncbi:MAG: hypothetical protein E4H01_15020 [Lysobacterales bacterium]|nr:MAG: hypothetical protein E4H01_15020 [Xanthomonadales bacterium]
MRPVFHQCELLGLSRSSFYYEPSGENEFNLTLMRRIDDEFTKHPFYEERLHEALGYRTPHEVYFGTSASLMPAEAMV